MKRNTPLRQHSKTPTAETKVRIQALLRAIVIRRDGGCWLRHFPEESGQCGGHRKDGALILQGDHIVSRVRNVSYGDSRNIVAVCKRHHFYWKKQYSYKYYGLLEKYLSTKTWNWIQKVEADKRSYHMGLNDWLKIELALTQELEGTVYGKEPRTLQQNRAMHLWFRQVAEALNDAGYDLKKTMAASSSVDIPWSEHMVKEILWKETQVVLFGKKSTTLLNKQEEIDTVYDTLNRFLGEKLGLESIPFPSLDTLIEKQLT